MVVTCLELINDHLIMFDCGSVFLIISCIAPCFKQFFFLFEINFTSASKVTVSLDKHETTQYWVILAKYASRNSDCSKKKGKGAYQNS